MSLQKINPYGFFAVPMRDIVRIQASSGTTGKQKVLGYTRNDLKLWGEVMARTLTAGGATADDIVHVSYGTLDRVFLARMRR